MKSTIIKYYIKHEIVHVFLLSIAFYFNSIYLFGANESSLPPDSCTQAKSILNAASQIKSASKRLIEYQKAVALCPDADIPHFKLGLALAEIEDEKNHPDYNKAEYEFRKVLSINPGHLGAIYELAGVEYVTGKFSDAEDHYDKFLKLDTLKDQHPKMNSAAERLSIKCGWLQKLPPNSFDLKYLREDPDSHVDVANLIGDIGMEVGMAATQVTGKIGYEAAGLAVLIASDIFANSQEVNFKKVQKAIKNNDWALVYSLTFKLLPETIEKKGINSTELLSVLEYVFKGGCQSLVIKRTPATQEEFDDLAPFARAYIYNCAGKYNDYGYPANAYQIMGDCKINKDPLLASNYYRHASLFWQLKDPNSPKFKSFSYKYRITAALLEAQTAFHDVSSLDSLLELNKYILSSKDIDNYANNVNLSYLAILDWSINIKNNDCNIEGVKKFLNYFQYYKSSNEWNSNIFYLYLSAVNILEMWGERNRAISLLETIQLRGIPSDANLDRCATYYKFCATTYTYAGLFDKAKNSIEFLKNFNVNQSLVFNYRLSLFLQMIYFNTYPEPNSLIQIYDRYNKDLKSEFLNSKTYIDLAEILNWLSLKSGEKSDSAANVQIISLLNPWSIASRYNLERFNSSSILLLKCLFSNGKNENIMLIYNQLIDICEHGPDTLKIYINNFSLIYYRNTIQLNKYLDLYQTTNPVTFDNNKPDNLSREYLLDRRNSHLAVIYHELGDYEHSLALRQKLLSKVISYNDIIPETIAEIKIRMAEDLAALGRLQESELFLNEAISAFRSFNSPENSLKYLRAIADLAKLSNGNKDIGPHGKVALEFYR